MAKLKLKFRVIENTGETMKLLDPVDAENHLDYTAETLEEVEWLKQFPVGSFANVSLTFNSDDLAIDFQIDPPDPA